MKKHRIRQGSVADIAIRTSRLIALITLTSIIVFFASCGTDQEAELPPVIDEVEITTNNYTYDVPLDPALQLYISNTCEDYGIDPALVIAMIAVESSYRTDCIGDGGDSIGLMQIQPKWWSERMTELGVTDLINPYENVTIGIDIIAGYLNKGRNVEWALHSYNGGVQYANEMYAYGKTSEYAKKVMTEAYRLTSEREFGYVLQ